MAAATDAPTDDAGAHPERPALVREALLAGFGILLVLGVVKHVGAVVPFVGRHSFTIAAAVQLYVPIFLIGRRGITKHFLGLRWDRWRADLFGAGVWAVVVTVPFAVGHHLWQTGLHHRTFTWRMPDNLLETLLIQVLVVGLAEELFFRGYLQGRLEQLWPAKRRLFGVPFGAAIVVAAAVFALAHFVGEYRPDRLGPFFPALVFGWLRARTGTILGAVVFHAYCNVLGDILYTFYRS